MTDLYLIAHKVRGEPAFDIAEKLICPECLGRECAECDESGHWWIASTSGHRAYPYWTCNLGAVDFPDQQTAEFHLSDMPPSLPDHYPTRQAPKAEPSTGRSLLSALGLLPKVTRRL